MELVSKRFVVDPRQTIDDTSLEAASRNGFPLVAAHVQRRDRAGLALGLLISLALGGFTFWSLSGHAPQAEKPKPAPQARAVPKPVPQAAPALPIAAAPVLPVETPSAPTPALIIDMAEAPAAIPAPPPTAGDGAAETVTASAMAHPAQTVAQGTMIAAVLETGLNSDLPGYARAIVSRDVQAFSGGEILIPRGSHLVGQYRTALTSGQRRAYILWSRLIRPDGVSIAIGSPATDFSGETGLPGEVNSHFFARFGSAMLLSAINLLSTVGSAGVILSSGSSSAASVAAQSDSQISPTITVPAGTPIRVFTAHDLDFFAVSGSEK
ncbi:type IV secretion system protein VirB10 [Rhizomicrobium palustre]|uniref:Type IV secretion system protein VirB10 n=1 Tax=Rhizomicrobium palustre TaxID=189966 RepID=A0A846N2I8_9PROT|nr:TrbI/VirB10 family protein [Rhizomicrobium palustre]NIK89823.1 type IV secretion system protein VirB10 [Rhizomicrobium palustre]